MFKEDTSKLCPVVCISWSAVVSGALVAIGLSFLFNLFGLSIGLAAYTPFPAGQKVLAVGGYVAIVLCVMISMFLSGWVSGYLGYYRFNLRECFNVKLAVLHGFSAWCVALLLSIFLMTHVSQFISDQEHTLYHNEIVSKVVTAGSNTLKENPPASELGSQLNENTKEVKNAGKSLLLTFILFFVGAVMSAYGAYRGMISQRECSTSQAKGD